MVFAIVVASSSSRNSNDENNIALTSISTDSSPERFSHDRNLRRSTQPIQIPVTTSLTFGGKSRYVLCGDDSGAVCLWDLKKSARVRHYFHDDPSIQVAMTDSEVISLSSSALYVYDLRQSTLLSKIDGNSFTCFTLCKTLVALGRADGNIDVGDWNDPESMQTYKAPFTSAITGLSISPVNQNLLAASSHDGQLVFMDVRTGQTIQVIHADKEISSLSFHIDGILCAIGSTTGHVFIYDLREPDQVVATQEFDGPIVAVEFAPRSGTTKSPLIATTEQESKQIMEPTVNKQATVLTVGRHIRDEGTNKDTTLMEETLHDAIDQVRDDMELSIRNLHIDMLRQFQIQSDEFTTQLTTQMQAITQLVTENDLLRNENKRLRHLREEL